MHETHRLSWDGAVVAKARLELHAVPARSPR